MKWIRYKESDMLRELSNDEMAALKSGAPILLLTSDGEYHVHREGQLAPRGVEHFALIEPPRKPWWEELPEEAVWFELETHPDRGSYAANECFARHPNGTYWHRLLSEEDAAVETWMQRYPEGKLIRWQ